ncbi:MAG: class I SAM-dependent methyltransferase [Rhodospirillales bacterium]
MGQTTTGWRGALSFPAIYEAAQTFMGVPKVRRMFIEDYVESKAGDKVLDLGCGPARLMQYLPDVDYLGVDISEKYIAAARREYGGRGRFEVMNARDLAHDVERQKMTYDAVFSFGLLHHIDDATAKSVIAVAHNALKPGGRYVNLDPAFRRGQSAGARMFGILDRGDHVRTPESYAALARTAFDDVICDVREDTLWLPVSFNLMTSRRSA